MHTERLTDNNGNADTEPRGQESPPADRASSPTPKTGAEHWFGRYFYACGRKGLPQEIACLGGRYVLEKVLKHDFHAATGLYRKEEPVGCAPHTNESCRQAEVVCSAHPTTSLPIRLIGKINRRTHFGFLPLGWIGRLMAHSEISKLRRCEGIRAVPQVLARIDSHMYVYEYIEGWSLNEKPALPADFFDRLIVALQQVHARNLVHFDLHKRGNILVDLEGRPHIIDFQIARHVGDRCLLSRRLSARFRRWLQSYDLYHVYKHKRRLQPELLTEAEKKLSYNHSLGLEIQRAIAKPYKRIRRATLRYLYAKGILAGTADGGTCVETNPVRWTGRETAEKKTAERP
jgi:hypothetical protein